jgi:hypothetical protein
LNLSGEYILSSTIETIPPPGELDATPFEYVIPQIAIPAVHLSAEYGFASGGHIALQPQLEAFVSRGWLDDALNKVAAATEGLDGLYCLAQEKYDREKALRDAYEQATLDALANETEILPEEFWQPYCTTKSKASLKRKKQRRFNDLAIFTSGPLSIAETIMRYKRWQFVTELIPYDTYEPAMHRTPEHRQKYIRRMASMAIGVSLITKVPGSSFASEITKTRTRITTSVARSYIEEEPFRMDYVMPHDRNVYLRRVLEAGTPKTKKK